MIKLSIDQCQQFIDRYDEFEELNQGNGPERFTMWWLGSARNAYLYFKRHIELSKKIAINFVYVEDDIVASMEYMP